MRSARYCLLLSLLFLSVPIWAQQSVSPPSNTPLITPPPQFHMAFTPPPATRDPLALSLLQKAVSAMGGVVPTDSVATGSVTIVAGTKTENGTIRILTRGMDQSSEQIQFPDRTDSVIYSRGQANEVLKGAVKPAPIQLTSSSQSPDFPLPLLAGALADPDLAIQYIAEETTAALPLQHIRLWKTYASKQHLQRFWDFTVKDLWVDPATGLPYKLSYERREASGAVPHFRIEVLYSNWKSASGAVYPYQIQKSWNGTPWTTIAIQNVAFQTGLSDTDFPITLHQAVKP